MHEKRDDLKHRECLSVLFSFKVDRAGTFARLCNRFAACLTEFFSYVTLKRGFLLL